MTIKHFFDIVEIRTKVISASTYLIATVYVWWSGYEIKPGLAVLLAVAVFCVDMGTTGFNSFFDYVRGVDTAKHSREKDKVLVHDSVAPGYALIVSVVLFAVAAATGIIVAAISTWWVLAIGAGSLLVGFLYTGGPLPISRTPLGELFAGGALGMLLFLVVVIVHTGAATWPALLASLPGTLVIASVLTVNNTCDIEGDTAAGRQTLSIVIGRGAGEILVYLQGVAAFALLVVMTLGGPSRLPPVGAGVAAVGLAIVLAIYRGMHRRGYSHETKPAQMGAVIRIVLVFTATYLAILGTGILFARTPG